MYHGVKLKRKLPNYLKMSQFVFDVEKLKKEAEALRGEFRDLREANFMLSDSHETFVNKISDRYFEVALTDYDGAVRTSSLPKQSSLSRIRNLDTTPSLDERNYGGVVDSFRDSYFYACARSMNLPIFRLRLALLLAGGVVDWHIDYDPSYATRLIIPIKTNELVINATKRDGQIERVHLPADGSVWFINTGFPHYVENLGDSDRISLILSVDGTSLWNPLIAMDAENDESQSLQS